MKTFFEQSNDIEISITNEIENANNYINNVINNSNGVQECHMSFYSVAKNVRFLSSYYFEAIKKNKTPMLSKYCRPNEDSFWQNITGQSWYPWLWGRHKSMSDNNIESWSNFFDDFSITNKESQNFSYVPNDFFLYLSCLNNVFKINKNYFEELKIKYLNFDWPSEQVVGLQIRRGEIVKNDGDINNSWNSRVGVGHGARPIYSIDDYINGVKKINPNTKYIFVSTDSDETIDFLVENYPDFVFLSANYDRNKFLRYNGSPGTVALEFDISKNQNLIEHYTDSCILDLYLLSKCNMYVGGMTYSEYGMLGWFLQMINQKKITKYYNVEGTLDLVNGNLKMLLI